MSARSTTLRYVLYDKSVHPSVGVFWPHRYDNFEIVGYPEYFSYKVVSFVKFVHRPNSLKFEIEYVAVVKKCAFPSHFVDLRENCAMHIYIVSKQKKSQMPFPT